MRSDFLVDSPSLICSGSGFVALDMVMSERYPKPRLWAGGSCGNVLTILSYFGWKSYPIARLGNDIVGDMIINDMKSWAVNTSFIERDRAIRSPIVVEWIRAHSSGDHIFEMKCPCCGSALPRRRPVLLKSVTQITKTMPVSNVFYFDRASPSILFMAKYQKQLGALVVFEPSTIRTNDLFMECLNVADIVKHRYQESNDLKEMGADVPLEIQTMGDKGLRYRTNLYGSIDEWTVMEPFHVSNLMDSAGAGDWCTAGIIHLLSKEGAMRSISKKKLELILKFGQCLGAINCYFEGARGPMYYMSKTKFSLIANRMMEGKFDESELAGDITQFNNDCKLKTNTLSEICMCRFT